MRRPEIYVPLSVRFHTGRTGTAILERFGLEGLAVWAAMLATAKTERPPGTIRFGHAEDWGHLGLGGHRPSFELSEFLTFLGRRHITRTTKVGQTLTTELRRWNEWNTTVQRENDNLRKARKRAQSTPDIHRDANPDPDIERERDNPLTPFSETPKPAQANGTSDPLVLEPPLSELDEKQRADLARRMAEIGKTIGS